MKDESETRDGGEMRDSWDIPSHDDDFLTSFMDHNQSYVLDPLDQSVVHGFMDNEALHGLSRIPMLVM